MQRQDIPHFTRAQVVGIIDEALEVLEEVAPPDALRVTTFDHAVRMLSGKEIVMVQAQPLDLAHLKGNGLL
jgi:hypothetical protein